MIRRSTDGADRTRRGLGSLFAAWLTVAALLSGWSGASSALAAGTHVWPQRETVPAGLRIGYSIDYCRSDVLGEPTYLGWSDSEAEADRPLVMWSTDGLSLGRDAKWTASTFDDSVGVNHEWVTCLAGADRDRRRVIWKDGFDYQVTAPPRVVQASAVRASPGQRLLVTSGAPSGSDPCPDIDAISWQTARVTLERWLSNGEADSQQTYFLPPPSYYVSFPFKVAEDVPTGTNRQLRVACQGARWEDVFDFKPLTVELEERTEPVEPLRMVSLGDSYTSGEGLLPEGDLRYDCGTDMPRDYYREDTTMLWSMIVWPSYACDTRTMRNELPDGGVGSRERKLYENKCHRNDRAYPNQIRMQMRIPADDFVFVACSGARTFHVAPVKGQDGRRFPNSPVNIAGGKAQLDTVPRQYDDADIVTIGIGGNDAEFADILSECITSRTSCATPERSAKRVANIRGAVRANLEATYRAITARYLQAKVFAFGYPSVVGDPDERCSSVGAGKLSISREELLWLRDTVATAIETAVKDAARAAGVIYVPIGAATRGFEVCSSADADDKMINGLRGGNDNLVIGNESFHPNQRGHDAIASWFLDHYTDGVGNLLVDDPAPAVSGSSLSQPSARTGLEVTGSCSSTGCASADACQAGCKTTVRGGGVAPLSAGTVRLQSANGSTQRRVGRAADEADGLVVGSFTANEFGDFETEISVPAGLPDGVYAIVAQGRNGDGVSTSSEAAIWVGPSETLQRWLDGDEDAIPPAPEPGEDEPTTNAPPWQDLSPPQAVIETGPAPTPSIGPSTGTPSGPPLGGSGGAPSAAPQRERSGSVRLSGSTLILDAIPLKPTRGKRCPSRVRVQVRVNRRAIERRLRTSRATCSVTGSIRLPKLLLRGTGHVRVAIRGTGIGRWTGTAKRRA